MLTEAPYSGPYIIPSANSGTGQPSPRLALPNSETQRYIQWRPETVEDLRLTGAMSEISNLVYQRLLSRPGPLISEGRKVFTLPADDGAEASFLAGNEPNAQSSLVHPSAVSTPASKNIANGQTGDPGDAFNADTADNAIVRQTNHYLTELQLPLLNDAETARLIECSSDVHTDLLPGYKRDNQDETLDSRPRAGTSDPMTGSEPRTASRSHRGRNVNTSSALAMSESVLGMLGVLGQTTQAAYSLDAYYRELRSAPEEAQTLARRLTQFSTLLQAATNVISDSTPSPVLVELSQSIIKTSSDMLSDVNNVLGHFFGEEDTNTLKRLKRSMRWVSKREAIGQKTSEVESLKIDLTVLLQMHQIQNSGARPNIAVPSSA